MPIYLIVTRGLSWSYDSRIKHNLCSNCISSLTLWVWITIMRDVDDTTLCHKVCSDLGKVGGFPQFPPPIKQTATIYLTP